MLQQRAAALCASSPPLHAIASSLVAGTTMIKIGRLGGAAQFFVFVAPDLTKLNWASSSRANIVSSGLPETR